MEEQPKAPPEDGELNEDELEAVSGGTTKKPTVVYYKPLDIKEPNSGP